MNKERTAWSLPGIATFLVLLAAAILLGVLMIWYIASVLEPAGSEVGVGAIVGIILIVLAFIAVCVAFAGLTPVNPNEARALVFVGHYAGTAARAGLPLGQPVHEARRISIRVRNFETAKLKVNDHDGNPIEIAAIVVWKVSTPPRRSSRSTTTRTSSTSRPSRPCGTWPRPTRTTPTSTATSRCAATRPRSPSSFAAEIQDRLQKAGVEVIEARISHLAYAPEIANAMLRRQQANAVIAARSRIVEGAVGMVEMALEQLSAKQIVQLDEERKAPMVSNLLVVLCCEHETQPVVNTGTLYA